jgi:hypothetical protein
VVWAAPNEAAYGWAYFAKKEYDSTLAPCVTYAYCKPQILGLTITPSSVTHGLTATGKIMVNGLGPGDQLTLSAMSLDTTLATVPASVTISGVDHLFTISTNMNATMLPRSVTITVSLSGGGSASAILTVN